MLSVTLFPLALCHSIPLYFEATGITLNQAVISNEQLKSALDICADSLKTQFGANFDSDTFSIGISDEIYEYDPSKNPFSESESGTESEGEIEY